MEKNQKLRSPAHKLLQEPIFSSSSTALPVPAWSSRDLTESSFLGQGPASMTLQPIPLASSCPSASRFVPTPSHPLRALRILTQQAVASSGRRGCCSALLQPRDHPHMVPTAGSPSISEALQQAMLSQRRQLLVLPQAKPPHPQNPLQALTPPPMALTHEKPPGRMSTATGCDVQTGTQRPEVRGGFALLCRQIGSSPFRDGSFHLPLPLHQGKKTFHGRKSTSFEGACWQRAGHPFS